MKISEIVIGTSRDDYIDSFVGNFADVTKTPSINNLLFAKNYVNDIYCFGLFDGEKLVSLLFVVHDSDLNKHMITRSLTDEQYRSRGLFRFLLEKAVDQFGEVLGDYSHSHKAILAWSSLITAGKPIYTYNTKTGEYKLADEVDSGDIWDINDNHILLSYKK